MWNVQRTKVVEQKQTMTMIQRWPLQHFVLLHMLYVQLAYWNCGDKFNSGHDTFGLAPNDSLLTNWKTQQFEKWTFNWMYQTKLDLFFFGWNFPCSITPNSNLSSILTLNSFHFFLNFLSNKIFWSNFQPFHS